MTIQAFKLGALGQDSLTGIKIICAQVGGNQYMTLESPVGTDYQVTAGKTLYLTQMSISLSVASTGIVIGYGDNGVAKGSTTPTNFTTLTEIVGSVSGNWENFSLIVPIPAGKYPCIAELSGNAGTRYVTLYGIEV